MTWFKVDDSLHSHPKIEALRHGPHYGDALALWTLAGSWCAQHLTDGFLPKTLAKTFGFRSKVAQELVRVGLWSEEKDGYRFHQWAERQPARSQVEQRRAESRERVDRYRAKKRAENTPGTHVVTRYNHVTADPQYAPPDPTRPDLEEREERESVVLDRPLRVPAHVAPTRAHAHEGFAAQAPWHEAPSPMRLDQPGAWTADRQALAFQKAYLARRHVSPSMHGKQLHDFYARVVATAQAREVEPEALFAQTLDLWLSRDHTKVERSAPYACFAQAFGELCDQDPRGALSPEIRRMQAEVAEVLRVVQGGK